MSGITLFVRYRGYANHTDSSGRLMDQIEYSNDAKALIWKKIVEDKVENQCKLLDFLSIDYSERLKEYRLFRKNLKKNAYIQLQESVYIKLLHISLNNFKKMFSIKGAEFNMSFFSDDIVIID